MGVDPMAKALKTKEERIELRVRPRDKRLLEKAAQAQGLSLSSYLVTKSIHAAHEDAAAYKTYTPKPKDADLFLRLLENPPTPSQALRNARKRFKEQGFNAETIAQAVRWARLAKECAKLDPKVERALAEEGMSNELKNWPNY
jgi:uncharacterized protein (DUF1778 family)